MNYCSLRIAFINVNSVVPKISFISDFIVENKVDLLGIGETWLLPGVLDSFISVDGFNVVRCDVRGLVPKHGVCLFINKNVDFL